MATEVETPDRERTDEIGELEEHALEHLEEAGIAGLEAAAAIGEEEEPTGIPVGRLAPVVIFPLLAAATMAGGVFVGFSPRIWAAVAAILGVLLAVGGARIRRPALMNIAIVGGLFSIGILIVIPSGFENVLNLASRVVRAVGSGAVQRPPVDFDPGWRAILGWLMGGLGLAAGWVALELRRPALGTLVPLPVIIIAAISVPESQMVASGISSLVFFAVGLGLLSNAQTGAEIERRSLAYEVRRGARSLLMIGIVSMILFAMSQSNLLFPPPLYDPAQEARLPQATPLTEVADRVLFTVEASFNGPWRMGHLDVYDGQDWRLPPFAEARLEEVPRSGIVDPDLRAGVRATFETRGLTGAVLPNLPNTVGLVAAGPKLVFDGRTHTIRLAEGQIDPGVRYTVVAARVPQVDELRADTGTIPDEIQEFLSIPEPPPAVRALLDRAPGDNQWDRLDFMRQRLLRTVTAVGQGTPVSVPPSRVQDLLAGSREGSPFEMVAAQAMLARWAGLPSRLAYGFDGGEEAGDVLEIRPRHAATWFEVYFPSSKWIPIVGDPLQAQFSVTDQTQNTSADVLPSEEAAVQLFVPIALPPEGILLDQVRQVVAIVVPVMVISLLLYYTWPALRKAILRARRRNWALQQGPRARIAVAYAEWRELATDFGYVYETDTPLMFLDRVVEDEEHTELAWLVTRGLWGELRDQLTEQDAVAAEELSRSLRKRMSQAHTWTLRMVAAVSRLSFKYPYAPGLGVEIPLEAVPTGGRRVAEQPA